MRRAGRKEKNEETNGMKICGSVDVGLFWTAPGPIKAEGSSRPARVSVRRKKIFGEETRRSLGRLVTSCLVSITANTEFRPTETNENIVTKEKSITEG